jgi:hypothetical protein
MLLKLYFFVVLWIAIVMDELNPGFSSLLGNHPPVGETFLYLAPVGAQLSAGP